MGQGGGKCQPVKHLNKNGSKGREGGWEGGKEIKIERVGERDGRREEEWHDTEELKSNTNRKKFPPT